MKSRHAEQTSLLRKCQDKEYLAKKQDLGYNKDKVQSDRVPSGLWYKVYKVNGPLRAFGPR